MARALRGAAGIPSHLMNPEFNLARLGRVLPSAARPVAFSRPLVVAQGLASVFGPRHGIGARSAVGRGPLPGDIAVEAILELR